MSLESCFGILQSEGSGAGFFRKGREGDDETSTILACGPQNGANKPSHGMAAMAVSAGA
jgi:hypothetical protein